MNIIEQVRGTFSCPICGVPHPHAHSAQTQRAYQEDQIRNDGWISTAKIRPTERGWYLCMGIDIPKTQDWMNEQQLDWFLWVREAAARGEELIPEVLYFDGQSQWSLRNMLGNAVYSGAENRRQVFATVKYWRPVPKLQLIVKESK
jgi:hypothetical protein